MRRAALTLLAVTAACGYDATGTAYDASPTVSAGAGLWVAGGVSPALLRLAPSQLRATGDVTPSTILTAQGGTVATLAGVAFDTDGTLWLASADDSTLLAFPRATLTTSGPRAAAVIIRGDDGKLSAPAALAFDREHRLWVANRGNGTLVRYDRAQLRESGAPVPTVVLHASLHPTALAVDAQGRLWVADVQSHRLYGYDLAQVERSGAPLPRVVLSALATSIRFPTAIAFDAAGDLWFANAGTATVSMFGAEQLSETGSPIPRVTLASRDGSLALPAGLAFDGSGSLWVLGGDGALARYSPASLRVSGAPAPAVRLRITERTLLWSMAFWPVPRGLPIN